MVHTCNSSAGETKTKDLLITQISLFGKFLAIERNCLINRWTVPTEYLQQHVHMHNTHNVFSGDIAFCLGSCDSVNVSDSHKLIGNGIIRRCSLVGGSVVSLDTCLKSRPWGWRAHLLLKGFEVFFSSFTQSASCCLQDVGHSANSPAPWLPECSMLPAMMDWTSEL